jgi:DNA-binding LacI/PurR family transcriptional regulator
MAKVTIETISRFTGLSRGTISRALNDRPDISKATKDRVLAACKQLEYVPSHAARALATGRNFTFAILGGELTCALTARIVQGALTRAGELGYAVHLLPPTLGDGLSVALQGLPERLDGTIVLAESLSLEGSLAQLASRPMVGLHAVAPNVDRIAPDEMESGRLAARHAARGGGPVVYLHRADRDPRHLRLDGFREGCEENDTPCRIVTLESEARNSAPPEGLADAKAVCATDDETALQAMIWLAGMGRVAGRDVRVVGQGNSPCAAEISPGLTSVDWCGEEIGSRLAELLVRRIQGDRMDSAVQTLVAPKLVVRESAS